MEDTQARVTLIYPRLASLLTSRYVTQGESVIGNPLVGAVHFYEVLRPRWACLQCERVLAERSGAEASEASIPVASELGGHQLTVCPVYQGEQTSTQSFTPVKRCQGEKRRLC